MPATRVLLAVLSLGPLAAFVSASTAEARIPLKPRAVQPVSVETAKLEGDCCAAKPDCCPAPCIVYRHCGPKLCCGCDPPKKIVLAVKDPCTGCTVDVPVCLPACCEGEPEVCCGTGLFCRDVVDYEWCCGFQVRVVFRHCGDLLVKTWGY